jgi:hypothetical protein
MIVEECTGNNSNCFYMLITDHTTRENIHQHVIAFVLPTMHKTGCRVPTCLTIETPTGTTGW